VFLYDKCVCLCAYISKDSYNTLICVIRVHERFEYSCTCNVRMIRMCTSLPFTYFLFTHISSSLFSHNTSKLQNHNKINKLNNQLHYIVTIIIIYPVHHISLNVITAASIFDFTNEIWVESNLNLRLTSKLSHSDVIGVLEGNKSTLAHYEWWNQIVPKVLYVRAFRTIRM